MALVLTLAVMALVTALVVEFAYGVYVNTEFLKNWEASEELRLSARSGVGLAAYLIEKETGSRKYTYPGAVDLPPIDPFADGTSVVGVRVEDEDSKFNLNSLVYESGELNEDAHGAFKRVLEYLDLDPSLADSVADWIDPDEVERAEGAEQRAKNGPMAGIEELNLVAGVSEDVYNRLAPYVTVHGSGLVNINGAGVPVLLSLSGEMTEEMAGRVVDYRDASPFTDTGELSKVAGFESLGISLIGKVSVKGTAFKVTSMAEAETGIKGVLECVLDSGGKVKRWREL
jgi:general secretion pathway protein K